MPDFVYNYKVYYNPVEFALHFIGGTWKMPILWRLNQVTMRYGELKKTLPHITHKMLSSQLRELEKHELVRRTVHAVVPPKVEYSITTKGQKVIPVIEVIRNYGLTMMQENGLAYVDSPKKKPVLRDKTARIKKTAVKKTAVKKSKPSILSKPPGTANADRKKGKTSIKNVGLT